jgi:ADP-ribose pyrophosphatase YjhB (NUDIX family)
MQNSCGILFISKPTKKIGIGLRSDGNNPNTWSTIGGGIEEGEKILDCLIREIKEELGIDLNPNLIPIDDNKNYKTFISIVDDEFKPTLNNEHSDFKWFNYDNLPDNLHPGLKTTLTKPFVQKVLDKHIKESTTTGAVGGYVQPLGSPIFRTNVGKVIEGVRDKLKSKSGEIQKQKEEIINDLIEKTKTLPLENIDLKDIETLKDFSINDGKDYLDNFYNRITNQFSEIDGYNVERNLFYIKNEKPHLYNSERFQIQFSPIGTLIMYLGKQEKFDKVLDTKFGIKYFNSTKELIEIIEKINEMNKNMEEKIVFTKRQLMEDVELGESTTTDSTGSYETPKAWAKTMTKKHWRHLNKPMYPGGKFMKVKEKCKKFPYCNQGDINAIELWEDDELVKESIFELSNEMNISENLINKIIKESMITPEINSAHISVEIGNTIQKQGFSKIKIKRNEDTFINVYKNGLNTEITTQVNFSDKIMVFIKVSSNISQTKQEEERFKNEYKKIFDSIINELKKEYDFDYYLSF